MKNYFTKLGLVSLATLFIACSNNEEETIVNDFGGLYKIQTISSSVPVDMNNDGVARKDYLQEVKAKYTSFNGEIIDYGYNNELPHNFAEARPTKVKTNDIKFLDIRFPIQRIDSLFQGNDKFEKMNMEYSKMYTSFIYKITDKTLAIESDPFNQFEFYKIKNFAIQRLSKEEFEVQFDYKVYDFSKKKWIDTNLNAKYIKIAE